MKSSTVKTLAIATALVAVGAIGATQCRAGKTAANDRDEALLPVLEKRVNDVARVEIETKDGPITLARDGERWVLDEKSGYTANDGKVRELIMALRGSRIVEEKTSNAARFGKLGLEAPDAEESNSKRVTLKDAKGETIATALIGNRRFGKGGFNQRPGQSRPEDQYYVHTGGDAPALLVTGKLNVDARAVGWVEQQFFDVARDRIKAARITHPSGELVEAGRSDMSATELDVLTIPDGKQAKEPNGTRPMLDALGRLRFDDVQKVDEVDWDGAEITKAEYFTEHGIRVTVETVEVPDENAEVVEGAEPRKITWARFGVDVAPDAMPEIPAALDGPLVATAGGITLGGDETPEGGEGEEGDEASEEAAPPTVAELEREASELRASIEGWAFAIPSWKTNALRMPLENLVQDIPPPAPEPEEFPEVEPSQDGSDGGVEDGVVDDGFVEDDASEDATSDDAGQDDTSAGDTDSDGTDSNDESTDDGETADSTNETSGDQ